MPTPINFPLFSQKQEKKYAKNFQVPTPKLLMDISTILIPTMLTKIRIYRVGIRTEISALGL